MAKQSGLGDNLYCGGYDLSGDTNSLSKISGPMTPIDVTSINQYANNRVGGLRDGEIDWISYFDPAMGKAHPVLSVLPVTDVQLAYCRGTTLGNPAACLVAKQINYDPTRASTGELTFSVTAQANSYGLEWGKQLTPGLATATGGTASSHQTAVAGTAASVYGGQAYLQVTALAGSAASVIVEHSTDNTTFSTLASFASVTSAPNTQRIATAGTATVDQYVRATCTQPGTASSVTFNVVFNRNQVSTVF